MGGRDNHKSRAQGKILFQDAGRFSVPTDRASRKILVTVSRCRPVFRLVARIPWPWDIQLRVSATFLRGVVRWASMVPRFSEKE